MLMKSTKVRRFIELIQAEFFCYDSYCWETPKWKVFVEVKVLLDFDILRFFSFFFGNERKSIHFVSTDV